MKRKHRFVIGYRGDRNVVYGKRHLEMYGASCKASEDYAEPMTEYQARLALKKMPCKGAVIWELKEHK